MAKLKPAGKKATPNVFNKYRGALPCLIVVIGGMVLILMLFYASLQSAGK